MDNLADSETKKILNCFLSTLLFAHEQYKNNYHWLKLWTQSYCLVFLKLWSVGWSVHPWAPIFFSFHHCLPWIFFYSHDWIVWDVRARRWHICQCCEIIMDTWIDNNDELASKLIIHWQRFLVTKTLHRHRIN